MFDLEPHTVERTVTPSFQQFCAQRQLDLKAWRAWLLTSPTAEDVQTELDGTIRAFRGIAAALDALPRDDEMIIGADLGCSPLGRLCGLHAREADMVIRVQILLFLIIAVGFYVVASGVR